MAIARFVSRKAGLQGDNDADFAKSEMLLEESVDLATAVGKAHYAADRKGEMDKVFAEVVPKHLAALEKLATGETLTGKVLAGDLAIFATLNILLKLQEDVLDQTPKVKAFYEKLASHEKLKPLVDDESVGMYYQRQ
jgi:glutathione S-transferase